MWPFKKRRTKPAPASPNKIPSQEELSYAVAYFVVPHYAFNDLDKAIQMWTKTPESTGPFFYLIACQMRKTQPDVNRAPKFSSRYGDLPGVGTYYLLKHPEPAAIDLSDRDPI